MSSTSVVGTTDATMAVQSVGSGPAGTSAPNGAADFLAAILQALAPGADGAAPDGTAPGGQAVPGATKAGADADGTADGTTDTVPDAAALGLVALTAPLANLVPQAPRVGAGVAGQAKVASVADGAATAATGDVAGVSSAQPTAAPATSAADPSSSVGAGHRAGHGHANVAAEADGNTSGTTGDIRMSGDAAGLGQAGAPSSGGTSSDAGAGQGQPNSNPVVAVAVTGPSQSAPAPTPATGPAAPVSAQVFPEVTSLVTRGDGTHRITLTLKPEALGEVRVVMTVRDGAVHVRLAAGHEAQQALLSGSSELTRLLEHAGATDTRIVVRDLGAGPAPVSGASGDRGADLGSNLGQAPGFGPGAGSSNTQDQHAGTRAEHSATEGEPDTGTRTNQSRPVQPVTRARTSGVDVTM